MNTLTTEPGPPDELVQWAVNGLPHNLLRIPRDRPWWHSKKIPGRTPAGRLLTCRCGMTVQMGEFAWADGSFTLFLGQCQRPSCLAILWHFCEK